MNHTSLFVSKAHLFFFLQNFLELVDDSHASTRMYNKRLVSPAVHLELSKRTPFGMDGKKGAPASAGDRQRNRQ